MLPGRVFVTQISSQWIFYATTDAITQNTNNTSYQYMSTLRLVISKGPSMRRKSKTNENVIKSCEHYSCLSKKRLSSG